MVEITVLLLNFLKWGIFSTKLCTSGIKILTKLEDNIRMLKFREWG